MTLLARLKRFLHLQNPIARFCIVFFSCVLVFGAIYLALRHNSVLDPFLNLNAWMATEIWNLFGNSAQAEGAITTSDKFHFEVTAECTSIVPTAILIAAVLAWPSTHKEKLIGALAGTAALFVINQVRILTLFYVGTSFPRFLDAAHYFVWQGLIVLIALGLWLFWAEKMVHPPSHPADTSKTRETPKTHNGGPHD